MLDNFSHYLFEYFFSCTLFLHFLECSRYQCWICCCCSSTKSCLTLCDPMDCSTLGSPLLYYLRSLLKFLFIESMMLSYMTVSSSAAAFSFCFQCFPASEIFCYHSTDLSDSAYFFSSLFSFYCEDWIISNYLSLFIHSLLSPNYS